MKKYILICMIALALGACKKDPINSQRISPDLVGVWFANEYNIQLSIRSVSFDTDFVRYRNYESGGNRWLEVTFPDDKALYQIVSIASTTMILKDIKSKDILFKKMP